MHRFVHLGSLTIAICALPSAAAAQDEESAPARVAAEISAPQEEDKLLLKLAASTDLVGASVTGNPNLAGTTPGSDRLRTDFAAGEIRFGTRGVLYSPLNTYVLATGALNLHSAPFVGLDPNSGGTPQPVFPSPSLVPTSNLSLHPNIVDGFGRARPFLHLAYAELKGLSTEGAGANIFVRAGRQFHFGISGVTFDGITLQYGDGAFQMSARAGQRAAVYNRVQSQPGLIAGAKVQYDFDQETVLPVLMSGEVLYVTRDLTPAREDIALIGANPTTRLMMGRLSADVDVTRELLVSARLDTLNSAASHAFANLHWLIGDGILMLRLDEKLGEEALYGASGVRSFVVQSSTGNPQPPGAPPNMLLQRRLVMESLHLNIPDRANYTQVDAGLELPLDDWIELTPGALAHLVRGDEATSSPWDATYYQASFGVHTRHRLSDDAGLEIDLDYDGQLFDRPSGPIPGTSGNFFTDATAGPEKSAHDFAISARYAMADRFVGNRALQRRSLSVGAGSFLRLYNLTTPHAGSDGTDSLLGVFGDASYRIMRELQLSVRYEFAHDSTFLLPELGGFHELFVQMEMEI